MHCNSKPGLMENLLFRYFTHYFITFPEEGRGTVMGLSCRSNGKVEILLQIHIKGCLHLTQLQHTADPLGQGIIDD